MYCRLLGLRKKTVAPGAGGLDEHLKNPGSTDLFGSSDAIVKHVLEVCVRVCVCVVYQKWCVICVYVHAYAYVCALFLCPFSVNQCFV